MSDMKILDHQEVDLPIRGVKLGAELYIPAQARAIIIFSHGSGSSRHSSRNRQVAAYFQEQGFGTLLFDLLSEAEDQVTENRFNIQLLTDRLIAVTQWVSERGEAKGLPIAYFGASTGAAVALEAAVREPAVFAVVSRGGRPDLSKQLREVTAAVLLLVGSNDKYVLTLNKMAYGALHCPKALEIIADAGHLFEEPGKMHEVAILAADWFSNHLPA